MGGGQESGIEDLAARGGIPGQLGAIVDGLAHRWEIE